MLDSSAFTPNNLATMVKLFRCLDTAKNQPLPSEPKERWAPGTPWDRNNEGMANKLKICPNEFGELVAGAISSDNEIIIDAFKKLISTVKIVGGVDLTRTKQATKDYHDSIKRHTDQVEKDKAQHQESIRSRQARILLEFNLVQEAWSRIIDSMTVRYGGRVDLSIITEWDQFLIEALSEQDNKLVRIKNGFATVKWDEAKDKPDHWIKSVIQAIKRFETIAVSEKERKKFGNLDWEECLHELVHSTDRDRIYKFNMLIERAFTEMEETGYDEYYESVILTLGDKFDYDAKMIQHLFLDFRRHLENIDNS